MIQLTCGTAFFFGRLVSGTAMGGMGGAFEIAAVDHVEREREGRQDLLSWHMFDWTNYRLCHMVLEIGRPGGSQREASQNWFFNAEMLGRTSGVCSTHCQFLPSPFFWVVAVANVFLIIANLFSFQVLATSSMQNTFQKPMVFFRLPEFWGHFRALTGWVFFARLWQEDEGDDEDWEEECEEEEWNEAEEDEWQDWKQEKWGMTRRAVLPVIWRKAFGETVFLMMPVFPKWWMAIIMRSKHMVCAHVFASFVFLWLNFSAQHMKPTCLWP